MKNIPLKNRMTTIYFTNHLKRQLVDFLKTYPCIIYVKKVILGYDGLKSLKESTETLTVIYDLL